MGVPEPALSDQGRLYQGRDGDTLSSEGCCSWLTRGAVLKESNKSHVQADRAMWAVARAQLPWKEIRHLRFQPS